MNTDPILVGRGDGGDAFLSLAMANRHGLVAGATGTGKTVTLQALAERLSEAGVPVFASDVKGDLSGLGAPGGGNERIAAAFGKLGLPEPAWRASPVAFWDILGKRGHPVRATVSDMGPLLMGRILGLSEVQQAVLSVLFRLADDRGLLLLDLKDLRALLAYASSDAKTLQAAYGLMSAASIAAVQRSLLVLEDQGGAGFFGEPALDIRDLMRTAPDGRGVVNVLAADEIVESPLLYSTFLLWLLSELFEELPEAGDLDRPKLVFFFDEAHLLFDDAPKALLERVERVVRLVRSKGVGVWFVTQLPTDVPEDVLGQLGNRVQHALRAFTPKDRKAVQAVAETFRPNPRVDPAAAVVELGVGEALVSFLDDEGRPSPVERVRIVPPGSRVGPLAPGERAAALKASPMGSRYDTPVDRVSAYETLGKKAAPRPAGSPAPASPVSAAGEPNIEEIEAELRGELPVRPAPDAYPSPGYATSPEHGTPAPRATPSRRTSAPERRPRNAATDVGEDLLRFAGRELGRQVVRGILGNLTGSSRRRR
ncbi:MAG: DUF853 family protein [Spirochaetes bacterium]|nr:DUF853 family protein [Spirochaetota bacterium]